MKVKAPAASCGGFGLHSVSVIAEQVPLALNTPAASVK